MGQGWSAWQSCKPPDDIMVCARGALMKVATECRVVAVILASTLLVPGCDGRPDRAHVANDAQRGKWHELARQYQADLSWIDHMREISDRGMRILTIDFQREWLVGPIVFPGVLVDATRTGTDSYVLHIRDDGFMLHAYDQTVILQLECSAAQAAQVLEARSRVADAYAVQPTLLAVARISRVLGRRYLETAHEMAADEDHPSGGYVVESALTKDWKVGFGECIHLEPIADSAN